MLFANWAILNLIIIFIPIFIYIYFRVSKRNSKIIEKLGDINLINKLIISTNFGRKKLKIILLLISVIFILFSLARPQIGMKTVEAKRKGVDVVVAIDTSLSMTAEDIKPNRIEKSKKEVSKLIQVLKGDRVGLVAFSGAAFILCPLTLDKNTARMFLNILDIDIMPVHGTAIGKAIDLAKKSFSKKERKYKVLIFITDGEDHEGDVLNQAEQAKEEGIRIFTIGIGKKEGEPIPIYDKIGKRIGYKKDKQGQVVLSKLDEETLKKIASITGGQYYHVGTGDWGLRRIYEKISSMEKKELKSKMITIYEEKYQYVLFFAILFLLLEVLLPERRKKKC